MTLREILEAHESFISWLNGNITTLAPPPEMLDSWSAADLFKARVNEVLEPHLTDEIKEALKTL